MIISPNSRGTRGTEMDVPYVTASLAPKIVTTEGRVFEVGLSTAGTQ